MVKVNVIGKYLESINSPRYTNYGTDTKRIADEVADRIKTQIQRTRVDSATHTKFSNTNRAYYPLQDEDKSNYFHSHIVVEILLKNPRIRYPAEWIKYQRLH